MRKYKFSFCCIVSVILLTSCDKGTSPVSKTIEAPSQPAAWAPSDDPAIARFLNYIAPKSATWIEHPPSGMGRIANYTVPGREGNESAHIVIYYFGPDQGGTVEMNIARWQSQFQTDDNGELPEPIVNQMDANSLAVTLVEISGQWKEMGAVAFKPQQLFLTAIVELPQGNVFIRFVGASETVNANKEAFLAMIRGIQAVDKG